LRIFSTTTTVFDEDGKASHGIDGNRKTPRWPKKKNAIGGMIGAPVEKDK